MKTLILVRHAKSSWAQPALADRERPLNARGRAAAAAMGGWLAQQGYQPDEVIMSPARRCRETWDGFEPSLEPLNTLRIEDNLYLAPHDQMLSVLRTALGRNVMMIAHMPGIGEFARLMRRDPPPLDDRFRKYPTCATLVMNFEIDHWADLQTGTGVVQASMVPRMLEPLP